MISSILFHPPPSPASTPVPTDSGWKPKCFRRYSRLTSRKPLGRVHSTLSVGAQEVAQGSDVQYIELAEVLVNLQIVPGQPAHKAAIDVVQAWTGMEEQEEFANALLQDSHDELMARVNKTHVAEDPSDDDLSDGADVESTGAGAGGGQPMPPPSYAKLSSFFGPLEHYAQACGNDEAGNVWLRRGCRASETLPSNQRGRQTSGTLRKPSEYTVVVQH